MSCRCKKIIERVCTSYSKSVFQSLQMHHDAILSLEDNTTVFTSRLPDTLVTMHEIVYALCLS